MGLKRLYEFSKIILLEFAPCMGLKSWVFEIKNGNFKFAPCMGLKSTEYYEKQKLILFAPCMGLKR